MSEYPPPAPDVVPAPQPPLPAPVPSLAAAHWAAGSRRRLGVPVGPARTAVLQAVRGLGFDTTAEHLGTVTAERGSKLLGYSLTAARVPLALEVRLAVPEAEGASGTLVDVRVEDRWGSAGRTAAAAAVYADVFTDVLRSVDEHLARADPAAAADFDQWWRLLPEDLVVAGASGAAGVARLDAAVRRRSARLLDGPRRHQPAASGSGVAGLIVVAPDSVAQVDTGTADGMLTAGQLVVSDPGAMPAPMVAQVHALVLALESQLAEARRFDRHDAVTLHVPAADKPVVTFLFQQAALRDALAVRQLSTCTTCRLEKVVNPTLIAERERARRLKVLQGSVGAVFGSRHVSPFILFGRIAQLRKSDPDFVCTRCQGTDADEKPITFCPRCGDRRDESVLRVCPHCKLDLRTVLTQREIWYAREPEPELPPPPEPLPSTDASQSTDASPSTTLSSPTDSSLTDGAAAVALDADAHPAQVTAGAPDGAAPGPGWFADPWGLHPLRFWDGAQWTPHVAAGGGPPI